MSASAASPAHTDRIVQAAANDRIGRQLEQFVSATDEQGKVALDEIKQLHGRIAGLVTLLGQLSVSGVRSTALVALADDTVTLLQEWKGFLHRLIVEERTSSDAERGVSPHEARRLAEAFVAGICAMEFTTNPERL